MFFRWVESRAPRGQKAVLFAVLSVLWVFPSLGAIWILALNWRNWSQEPTVLSAIQATRLEQWLALALLAAHGLFIFLARRVGRARV